MARPMVAKPHPSPEQTYCGPVWFVAHTRPAKKLVAYYVLVYVWFVAKILSANGYLSLSLSQILAKVLVKCGLRIP
jgi:hypothetical protein